jgi:hypothetical protein
MDAPAVLERRKLTEVTQESSLGASTFEGLRGAASKENSEFRKVASGGRCQWVLDAIFRMVEWLRQPLRFNSVVLRTALDLTRLV